jgi:hypothetical protein
MAKIDLSDLKGIKLDEILSDWRDEAAKRASGLVGEGRGQIKRSRRAVADPNDGDMFGAFVLGVTVGALIGAAIALVLTPVSGSEARRKLAEQAEKIRGENGPEWETGGTGLGNGKTAYQSTPTYGGGTPVR